MRACATALSLTLFPLAVLLLKRATKIAMAQATLDQGTASIQQDPSLALREQVLSLYSLATNTDEVRQKQAAAGEENNHSLIK